MSQSLLVVTAAARAGRDHILFGINIGIGADGTEPDEFRVKRQVITLLFSAVEP